MSEPPDDPEYDRFMALSERQRGVLGMVTFAAKLHDEAENPHIASDEMSDYEALMQAMELIGITVEEMEEAVEYVHDMKARKHGNS